MSRSFSSADAKRLIHAHQEIITSLRQVRGQWEYAPTGVKDAADAMVTAGVMEVLRGVPVEEINRGKRGFKVKTLRDSGYATIADLSGATVQQLAAINGIGEESAYLIRGIVDEMITETRKGTKIRISEDRKTPEATALVIAISRFRRFLPLAERAARLQEGRNPLGAQETRPWNSAGEQEARISSAVSALAPASNGLKWFFTGGAKKQQAEEAFAYLSGLLGGGYGTEARRVIRLAEEAARLDGLLAWGDFRENSVRFFNVLEEIVPGVLGAADAVYGLPEDLAQEIRDEEVLLEGLRCELRRYQKWGVKYILHQKRVLLGDEMGLGKTVQAIAAMVSLKNGGLAAVPSGSPDAGVPHFLVVCPASVITNWCREIEGKSTLPVTKDPGRRRGRDDLRDDLAVPEKGRKC